MAFHVLMCSAVKKLLTRLLTLVPQDNSTAQCTHKPVRLVTIMIHPSIFICPKNNDDKSGSLKTSVDLGLRRRGVLSPIWGRIRIVF